MFNSKSGMNMVSQRWESIISSSVTLLFEHSPSWASEIEHFEIFSRPQENQLA